MPKSIQKSRRGITVTFTESDHVYRDDSGRVYKSVSSLYGPRFSKFDPVAQSDRMQAEGRGDAEALRAEWERAKNEACKYGTRCHETAEAVLQGQEPPHKPISDKERQAFATIWNYCTETILPNLEVLGTEVMLFSHAWEVAGTVDLLCRNKSGKVFILDWKTNREIRAHGFGDQAAIGNLRHLPDCEMSKYGLQLSLYERIIRFESYLDPCAEIERAILHVSPDMHEGMRYIRMPDYRLEAAEVLLDHVTSIQTPF